MFKKQVILGIILVSLYFVGCAAKLNTLYFPPSKIVFFTSGDGDIQKPYTPVGQLFYYRAGFRIPFPLLGLLPVNDVNPDTELTTIIAKEVKKMKGNAVINLKIDWSPPSNGFLGFMANGGHIVMSGTVIKQ